jgi:crossover junction endodeoxyribonuclease RuvC
MRILGIDPGIRNTGWGVVEQSDNRLRHIANGVIRPKPNLADAARLHFIAVGVAEAIAAHRPDAAAIEEIFVAKSATSALKLGMARGVAMMQCGEASLPLMEISARRVKKSVAGTGTADKRQMQDMVERLLGIRAANADAADALAIAIAAGHDMAPFGLDMEEANRTGNRTASGLGSAPTGGIVSGRGSGLSAAIEKALARDAGEDGR